jgi:2,3-dihydroxybenzoate-AMP ligase
MCGATVVFFTNFEEASTYREILQQAHLVIFFDGKPPTGTRCLHATELWRNQAQSMTIGPLPRRLPVDRITRIACSSGTTGAVKYIPQTERQQDMRVAYWINALKMTQESRLLIGVGFSVAAEHTHATACLWVGGTCVYSGSGTPLALMQATRATHYMMLPFFLSELLQENEAGPRLTNTTLSIIGGSMQPEMRQNIEQQIGCRVVETYATNEAGPIATIEADGTASAIKGIELEIVDEENHRVPWGEVGNIRIRGAACSIGYLYNDTATAQMFRNGWFYPGDMGRREDDSRFRLRGRTDDLLNVRGIKFIANEMERQLLTLELIQDVGLMVGPGENHLDALLIGIVQAPTATMEDIKNALRPAFASKPYDVHIILIDQIPRPATGKIQRNTLKSMLIKRMSGDD